jgi:hypothetical protein
MNDVAVVMNSGVDAAFLIQWMAVIIMGLITIKLITPWIPMIGPWLDNISGTTSAIERAIPALKTKGWWKQAMSLRDVLLMIVEFCKIAEQDKVADPNGEIRSRKVKERIRAVFGVKHEWSPEQEKAVEQLIDVALSNEGLIGKAVQGSIPARFRDAIVPQIASGDNS